MAKRTIQFGALLIVIGLGTFAMLGFDPGKQVALIPACFGSAFLVVGFLALKKIQWRMYMMHAAVAMAVLMFLVMMPGVLHAMTLLGGGHVLHPDTAVTQSFAAILGLGYVGRAMKSYRDAHRQKVGEPA